MFYTPALFVALRGLAATLTIDCNTRDQKTDLSTLCARLEALGDPARTTDDERHTAALTIIERGERHRDKMRARQASKARDFRTLQEQRRESFYVRALAILEPTVTF